MAGDVQKCTKCENEVLNASEIIPCYTCKRNYHNNCIGISNTAFSQIRKVKGFFWNCENCTEGHEILKGITEQLLAIKEELKSHTEKLKILENKSITQIATNHRYLPSPASQMTNTPVQITPRNKRLYSTVFQSSATSVGSEKSKKVRYEGDNIKTPKRNVIKMKNAVIIKPKTTQNANAPLISAVKSVLKRGKDRVSGIKQTRSGNLLVQCDNNEACKEVINSLKPHLNDCDIEQSSDKFWPRFVIINAEYKGDIDFIGNLQEENSYISIDSDVKVVKVMKNEKSGRSKVIIECDPTTGEKIRQKREITVDWEICPIYEHVAIIRCYQCCNFGHIAANCKKEKICSKCGEGHDANDCKVDTFNCMNCERYNAHLRDDELHLSLNIRHSVFSTSCPLYRQKAKKKLARMSYSS